MSSLSSVTEQQRHTSAADSKPNESSLHVETDHSAFVTPHVDELTVQAPSAPLIHLIGVSLAVGGPFAGVIVAMSMAWRFGWLDGTQLSILVVGYALTGLGITLGYHRLFTHRSFETWWWMRAFWMVMGALAVQKSPIDWCSTHRKHHALSDRPGDPHSPHENESGFFNGLRGFWHAHVGWLWTGHIIKTDHVRYVPDLLKDPLAVWIHRTWEFFWLPMAFVLPALIAWLLIGTADGALLGFLWGGCVRIFLVQHMAFSVNSICHMFGRKDYEACDESRNNFVCGIFSGGEGFHNNHHAFPTSARHGLEWWQPDMAWYVIRVMQMLGLAWNVQLPTHTIRQQKRLPAPGGDNRDSQSV